MGSLKAKLRHAFAVDPPGKAEPTPQQQVPVDWLCKLASRKHLTTPALVTLEMCRPLNWMFAQVMHIFQPAVWAITPQKLFASYKSFAGFLENRGSIEYMLHRVEHWEEHFQALEAKEAEPAAGDAADESTDCDDEND